MITLSRFDLAMFAVAAGALVSSTVFVLIVALTSKANTARAAIASDSTLAKAFVSGFKDAIADWPAYFAPMLWIFGGARRAWGQVVGLSGTRIGRWQLAYALVIIGQSFAIFFYVLNI